MSKILFWSPYHGLGQTSNIHAVAVISSMLYKKSVLLMQTHFKNNNLENPLVGNALEKGSDAEELFQGIGLDMAVTYSNMNSINRKTLESCCLTFPRTSLLLLPGTEVKNKETYDRDIGQSVIHLIKDADELVDLILIDANSGKDDLSLRLMDTADLVIINLTQRRYVLEEFFREYGEQFQNKTNVFYLFGDYDVNSSYNFYNLRRKYGKHIKINNSGVIPYCTKYMDKLNESDVLSFMVEGLKQQNKRGIQRLFFQLGHMARMNRYEKEETDYFFYSARLSVEMIYSLLHRATRKEPREGRQT